jgi:hypothetical protein
VVKVRPFQQDEVHFGGKRWRHAKLCQPANLPPDGHLGEDEIAGANFGGAAAFRGIFANGRIGLERSRRKSGCGQVPNAM